MKSVLAILSAAALCATASVALFTPDALVNTVHDHRGQALLREVGLVRAHSAQAATRELAAEYTLSTSASTVRDGDIITVTLTAAHPSQLDWVGVYAPADADPAKVVPIKVLPAVADPGYISNGKAELSLQLVNMRQDFSLKLFSCAVLWPVCQATQLQEVGVTMLDKDVPQRLRLTLLDGPTDWTPAAVWNTALSPEHAKPWVAWRVHGKAGAAWHNVTQINATTYNQTDMCDAPANAMGWFDPGYVMRARLDGAPDNTKLDVIAGDARGVSTSITGASLPAKSVPVSDSKGALAQPTRLLLVADMGHGAPDSSDTWDQYGAAAMNVSKRMADDLAAGIADATFIIGDVAYAFGFLNIWDWFLAEFEQVASAAPVLTVGGNHERDASVEAWSTQPKGVVPSIYTGSDSGGECGRALATFFPSGTGTPTHPWWSIDVGAVHLIATHSEVAFGPGSAQYEWLENDLKSVNRSVTPWVVFTGHRPMWVDSNFTVGNFSDGEVAAAQQAVLEPLLWKYRVNFAMYGHHHSLQRTCSLFAGKCYSHSTRKGDVAWYENPTATVHMVVGTGGAGYSAPHWPQRPDMFELFEYSHGHLRLEAVNSTQLQGTMVHPNGTVLDAWVITQQWPVPTTPRALPAQPHKDGPSPVGLIVAGSLCGAALIGAVVYTIYRKRQQASRQSLLASHGSPYASV